MVQDPAKWEVISRYQVGSWYGINDATKPQTTARNEMKHDHMQHIWGGLCGGGGGDANDAFKHHTFLILNEGTMETGCKVSIIKWPLRFGDPKNSDDALTGILCIASLHPDFMCRLHH